MFRELQAVAMLSGTILGVGIFSLPYLLTLVGVVPMLILFGVLGGLLLFLQRAFADMIAKTNGSLLIPGYIGIYLNATGKGVAFFTSLFSMLFAMLAYLIVGGIFLADLFAGALDLSPAWWASGIFLVGGYFILRGARTVARVELVFLCIVLLLFLFVFAFGFPMFSLSNFPTTVPGNPFLAFGAIFFSLWGMAVLPELKRILGEDAKKIRRVVTISFLFVLAVTVVFTLIVAGITGAGTTEDALTGLERVFDAKLMAVLFIFGFIAIFTSYLSMGVTLRDVLHDDFQIPWAGSFLVSAVLPFFLYVVGVRSLIGVVSFTGIVFLAAEGILVSVALVHFTRQKHPERAAFRTVLLVFVILALFTGAVLALTDFLTAGL